MLEKFFIGKYLNKMLCHCLPLYVYWIPITWAIFAIDDIGQLLGVFYSVKFLFLVKAYGRYLGMTT